MILLIQAIILSIVQGIAEWFPVSSSGHLAVIQGLFGFQSLSFDVFLHLASILAVIVVFYKDIIRLFSPFDKHKLKYIFLIIIALIPAGIAGVLFEKQIEAFFSSIFYLGIFFIISGVLVYSTKFYKERKEKVNFVDSIFIGILQAIAILPGISRSGATISGGLYRGLKKSEAVKFSFILAIPVVLGAAALEARHAVFSDISYFILIVSFIVTFIISLIVIKVLLKVIEKGKFYWFGVYNFIFGIVLLIIHFIGVM